MCNISVKMESVTFQNRPQRPPSADFLFLSAATETSPKYFLLRICFMEVDLQWISEKCSELQSTGIISFIPTTQVDIVVLNVQFV